MGAAPPGRGARQGRSWGCGILPGSCGPFCSTKGRAGFRSTPLARTRGEPRASMARVPALPCGPPGHATCFAGPVFWPCAEAHSAEHLSQSPGCPRMGLPVRSCVRGPAPAPPRLGLHRDRSAERGSRSAGGPSSVPRDWCPCKKGWGPVLPGGGGTSTPRDANPAKAPQLDFPPPESEDCPPSTPTRRVARPGPVLQPPPSWPPESLPKVQLQGGES